MGKPYRICSNSNWLCCWPGKRLEISLFSIQKWRSSLSGSIFHSSLHSWNSVLFSRDSDRSILWHEPQRLLPQYVSALSRPGLCSNRSQCLHWILLQCHHRLLHLLSRVFLQHGATMERLPRRA